ncbi:MAG: hypothetical protein ACRC62_24140 [Microcoleus sp.]
MQLDRVKVQPDTLWQTPYYEQGRATAGSHRTQGVDFSALIRASPHQPSGSKDSNIVEGIR